MEVKSIKSLVLKFGISYILILLVLGVFMNILGITLKSSAITIILIFFLLRFFLKKYIHNTETELSKHDFIKIFFGAYLFVLSYDLFTLAIAILSKNLSISQSSLITVITFAIIINAAVIILTIYQTNKSIKKNLLAVKQDS